MTRRLIAFAGSRTLPEAFRPVIQQVLGYVKQLNGQVMTGCATGADQMVVEQAATQEVACNVCAVGDRDGEGFWKYSMPLATLRQAHAVAWTAGGEVSLDLRARLRKRSQVMVEALAEYRDRGVKVGLVAFLGSKQSGAFRTCEHAAKLGLPVLVMPAMALGGNDLPKLGVGHWRRVSTKMADPWYGFWKWQPEEVPAVADQAQREARCDEEGEGYQMIPEKDGTWWIWNPGSRSQQAPYVTSPTRCSCPDWQNRGSKNGTECKHMIELKRRLTREEERWTMETEADEPEPVDRYEMTETARI